MSIKTFETAPPVSRVGEFSASSSLIVPGFVVAHPVSGQMKAVLPSIGVYSDITFDSLMPIPGHFDRSLAVPVIGTEQMTDTVIVTGPQPGEQDNLGVHHTSISPSPNAQAKGGIMRRILDFDARDLAVMIGTASIAGSLTNMTFDLLSGSQAPALLGLAMVAAGFVAGRKISFRLRKTNHG